MDSVPSNERLCPTKRLNAKLSTFKGRERMLIMNKTMAQNMLSYKNSSFAAKDKDVFIVTFPKCGTTWLEQIVKLIDNNGQEDGTDVDEAVPWLDFMSPEEAEAVPSPRRFKSHRPYKLLPGGEPHTTPAKYISIYRNPKDTYVSAYNHFRRMFSPETSWDEFFERTISGKFAHPSGNFFDYFLDWWKHKDAENILLFSYEWMKANHYEAVESIAKFVGYNLSPSVVSSIVEQTTFKSMKTNPAVNMSWSNEFSQDGTIAFMHTGKVGNWRDYFTDKQSTQLKEEAERKLYGTGLTFEYS